MLSKQILFGIFAILLILAGLVFAENTPDKTIVYKTVDDTELHLFIFNPEPLHQTKSYPCIVFYHGGGWGGGSYEQFFPHSRYLTTRGMVAGDMVRCLPDAWRELSCP